MPRTWLMWSVVVLHCILLTCCVRSQCGLISGVGIYSMEPPPDEKAADEYAIAVYFGRDSGETFSHHPKCDKVLAGEATKLMRTRGYTSYDILDVQCSYELAAVCEYRVKFK